MAPGGAWLGTIVRMKLSQRLVVGGVWLLAACGGGSDKVDEHGDSGTGDELALDAEPGAEELEDADVMAPDADASEALDADSSADSGQQLDAAAPLDAQQTSDAAQSSDAEQVSDAEQPSDAAALDATLTDASDAADASPDAPQAAPVVDPQQSGFLA